MLLGQLLTLSHKLFKKCKSLNVNIFFLTIIVKKHIIENFALLKSTCKGKMRNPNKLREGFEHAQNVSDK